MLGDRQQVWFPRIRGSEDRDRSGTGRQAQEQEPSTRKLCTSEDNLATGGCESVTYILRLIADEQDPGVTDWQVRQGWLMR